jgi:hemolysin activation/secretion protein
MTINKLFTTAILIALSCVLPAQAAPTLNVSHYVIDGVNPLPEDETAAILAPYIGEKQTLGQIEEAAKAFEKVLRDRGLVFYRVFVPAQKPENGEVKLQLTRFAIGTIKVTGNEHFSEANIRRSVPSLQEGESPDIRSLAKDITTANNNPAKQVVVKFREGQQTNTIDSVVRVRDIDPLALYVGYTANRSFAPFHEGESIYRMTFTAQHSNLFDRDQVGTLTYSTDPGDVSKVTLLGAYYQVPLYGTGINISGYYTHTDVSTGRIQQGGGFFDVSGRGDFYGIKVIRALPSTGNFHHTIGVALDHRYFENSTTFKGVQIQPNVGSLPLSLSYAFRDEKSWGAYAGILEFAVNTGAGAANSLEAHAANGGDYHWSAWRYSAEISHPAGNWLLSAKLRGQWTNDALIAGEQFGLGGANSVRGFSDREVTGDYGFLFNLEAAGPPMLVPDLKPVVFIDGGQAHSKILDHTEGILSAGLGLRWSFKHLDTALDIAHAFDKNGQNPDSISSRLHFSAIYRF